MAIDFMAIAKGREAANDQNWQDYVRNVQRKEDVYNERGREMLGVKREQDFQAGQDEQQAAFYLAPLSNQRQLAVGQVGPDGKKIEDIDWMLRQRDLILADENYQRMRPEAQQAVMRQFGASANLIAQARRERGDTAGSQRLLNGFTDYSQLGDLDVAISKGDVNAIITLGGHTIGPDGKVDVGGVKLDPIDAAAGIASERGGGGVLRPALEASRVETAKTEAQKLVDQQNANQLLNSRNTLLGNKYVFDAATDTWSSPDGKDRFRLRPDGQADYSNLPPPIPGVSPVPGAAVATTTTVAGVPGAAAVPGAPVVPGAPGAAPVVDMTPVALPGLELNTPQVTPDARGSFATVPQTPLQQAVTKLLPQITAKQQQLQESKKRLDAISLARYRITRDHYVNDRETRRVAKSGHERELEQLNKAYDLAWDTHQTQLGEIGDLREQQRDIGANLNASQSASTNAGGVIARGYVIKGATPESAATFKSQYPNVEVEVVPMLQQELERATAQLVAATTEADRVAWQAYIRNINNAIANFGGN